MRLDYPTAMSPGPVPREYACRVACTSPNKSVRDLLKAAYFRAEARCPNLLHSTMNDGNAQGHPEPERRVGFMNQEQRDAAARQPQWKLLDVVDAFNQSPNLDRLRDMTDEELEQQIPRMRAPLN